MADSTTRAIRQFFETRARASAAREAYDHWTWNVDPGADYRTREEDRMANTLADLCLCLDDLCDQAESEMRRCACG